jgi:flagellar basal-body rod protein FlgF
MILQLIKPVQAGVLMERRFDMVANHLANADTAGFKADILSFDEELRAHQSINFSQGSFKPTGNTLDLALEGEGFFKIQTPGGVRYTRGGNFTLDNQGQLVDMNGNPVLGDSGPITIEGKDIIIGENGEILVDNEPADALKVVTFRSLDQLQKEGQSLFVYKGSPAEEIDAEKTIVKQGALESPNVNTVAEMAKMIEVMRAYQGFQKMIQTIDDIDGQAISQVGKSV